MHVLIQSPKLPWVADVRQRNMQRRSSRTPKRTDLASSTASLILWVFESFRTAHVTCLGMVTVQVLREVSVLRIQYNVRMSGAHLGDNFRIDERRDSAAGTWLGQLRAYALWELHVCGVLNRSPTVPCSRSARSAELSSLLALKTRARRESRVPIGVYASTSFAPIFCTLAYNPHTSPRLDEAAPGQGQGRGGAEGEMPMPLNLKATAWPS